MSEPRSSASILVTRGTGEDLEVLLIERSPRLRFFGGYWAFPGGATETIDDRPGDQDLWNTARRCAVRELVEETGLRCRGLAGDSARLRDLSERLHEDAGAVAEWSAILDASWTRLREEIQPVCRITTPEFAPIRFSTEFVHLTLEADEPFRFNAHEIVQGRFVKPSEAVRNWVDGRQLIAPPVLFLLEILAGHGLDNFRAVAAERAARFEQGDFHPARFSPGIFIAPLASPTLPPARATNCLIVGTDRLYVIDPAAIAEEGQTKITRHLERLVAAGARIEAILLTHHHRDHFGSAGLLARRFGVPVRAHAATFERLAHTDIEPGPTLQDGDVLELGTAPDGTPGWQLEALYTPGHAPGHLCFMENRYRAAVVGDMLSTVSTIVIDPPEGHMATYLKSLERLQSLDIGMLYPAHGPAFRDGAQLVRHYLTHRRQREQMILKSLAAAPQSLAAILPQAYGDVAEEARPVALRSLLAGLEKLAEDGAARRAGEGWCLA
ncbi:MAG: MBL fold metallo-hydrolase [Gammaproteobacteria bacterium]|nr:MBL fold metallo-hydrolase [Gammaproteobacteria bacterium]